MQYQIDFDTPPVAQARAVGQVAGEMAQGRAERREPGFSERAKAHILVVLRERGPTSGETLTEACAAEGIKAPDMRAFGPIFAALVRQGRIRCVGYCLRKKGRGTAGGRIWRLA